MYLPIFITTREDHSLATGLESMFRRGDKLSKPGSPSATKKHPGKRNRSKKALLSCLNSSSKNTLRC
jgi:hypothetical protein